MIKAVSVTDVGKRRQLNQDIVFASEKTLGQLPNVFIVADGMGGHNAGDYASRYTVEVIVDRIKNDPVQDPEQAIREAIETANWKIREAAQADDSLSGMGTTVVVATYLEGVLKVANVGDSRLYVIGQEIRQITRDHSLVEEMIRMGGIDRNSARNHPDKNIITRAIGAQKSVEIDFFEVNLLSGEVVLMCSDGLTNMLTDEEILSILRRQQPISEKADELIKAANNNGGRDNIAVILIDPFAENSAVQPRGTSADSSQAGRFQ